MNIETEILLEDIKFILAELDRYKAFIAFYHENGYYKVLEDDVIDLKFDDLIKRIEKVLE